MKKLLLTSTIATLFISPIMADTGTLLLQGTVDPVLSITVNPVSGVNNDLNLSVTQTNLKVAEVVEQSNTVGGYKIFAKSTNGGSLNNAGLDSVDYTIGYNNGGHISLTTENQEVKENTVGGVISANSDVDIAYTGKAAALLVQGTYSDTVTFTIQSN
jgi:hypothetical protein